MWSNTLKVLRFGLILFLTGCSSIDSYYLVGSEYKVRETKDLLRLLQEEPEGSAGRFVLLRQITNNLIAAGYRERAEVFLTTYVENHPEDPFNAYYLFQVARSYQERNALPVAAYYYNRILKNHPDLIVQDKSIHLRCLLELIRLTEKAEHRIYYYKELQARFPNETDTGAIYYYMGRAYETLGEWDLAIEKFTKFLAFPDAVIPENSDAHSDIANFLAFHHSDKRWTRETLDEVVREIKAAIGQRDVRALLNLRAQVNFFAVSWKGDETESDRQAFFDIGTFLRRSPIRYARTLDGISNEHEAFLETWGWSYRIPTWFLYFRRINYPQDPVIHGRWEWAGIFFGEKL